MSCQRTLILNYYIYHARSVLEVEFLESWREYAWVLNNRFQLYLSSCICIIIDTFCRWEFSRSHPLITPALYAYLTSEPRCSEPVVWLTSVAVSKWNPRPTPKDDLVHTAIYFNVFCFADVFHSMFVQINPQLRKYFVLYKCLSTPPSHVKSLKNLDMLVKSTICQF